jgi:hypothetical protein
MARILAVFSFSIENRPFCSPNGLLFLLKIYFKAIGLLPIDNAGAGPSRAILLLSYRLHGVNCPFRSSWFGLAICSPSDIIASSSG